MRLPLLRTATQIGECTTPGAATAHPDEIRPAMLARALIGLALAVAIALAARRAGSLSTSGAVAAVVLGTVAFAAGWSWAIVLIAFFAASTALSRWREDHKADRMAGIVAKGGRRDAVQVLANGGIFAACAVLSLVVPWPGWPILGAGSIAASTADTWATEIGALAPGRPRSIVSWQPVPTGTSGGVSLQGTAAALAGAMFVAAVARLVGWPAAAIPAALAGGLAGTTADSLLGATLQARRWCASCAERTERAVHRCGSPSTHAGGLPWLGNDAVNAVGGGVGALVAGMFLR